MLYGWQSKSRQTGQSFEDQKQQQAELARLKRDNARLEEEVTFLKKGGGVLCETVPVRHDSATRTGIFGGFDVPTFIGFQERLFSMENAPTVETPPNSRAIGGRSETYF
jgi:hypothetical protein